MIEENRVQLRCAQGHASTAPGARFCAECGAPVNAAAAPPAPPHVAAPVAPPAVARPVVPHPVMRRPAAYLPPPAGHAPPPYFQGPAPQGYAPVPYPAQPPLPYVVPVPRVPACGSCGGDGRTLNPARIVCGECGWLRPLAPGYAIDCSAFQWSEDGKAMSALRALRPLNAAARAVSDKIGRRWVETTFNAVLLGENQLPDVYAQAVRAARLLGMSHMPDVYVSGERMWDCLTFGSDRDSFILLGTAIVTNFQGDDLLFLLAREIGHCRAGHALWKTVTRFLLGDHGPRKGLLSNGVFAALSPSALLEGALEMPLLAWARQAEITADRAGLLAVGDEGIARRVLLSWTLKSAFLYRRINIDAWLEQQAADEDSTMTRLSELTTSSTPYITRRLNLLTQFARSPELAHWRSVIGRFAPPLLPAAPPQPNGGPALAATQSTQPPTQTQATQASPTGARPAAGQSGPRPTPQDDDIRLKCASCGTPMRVPKKVLAGKQQLNVRCPNSGCTKLVTLRRKAAPAAAPNTAQQPAALNNTERNQSNGDE